MASTSSLGQRKYDVFLSFRGEDTRKAFLSHLYEYLRGNGILTFKDDHELKFGESISEKLEAAIRDSRFAIAVISENYASSRWCLEELRIIMELQRNDEMTVFPIFYEVDPSDVRNQRNSFAVSQRYGDSEAPEWENALKQVASLKGADSRIYKEEATVIKDIVEDISNRLQRMRPIDVANLVGMDAHLQRLIDMLDIESEDEVRMIGISGMAGRGKTAVAEYLDHKFSWKFEARCFIRDIGIRFSNRHLLYLKKEYLSNILKKETEFWSDQFCSLEIKGSLARQKNFVVLDDVTSIEQLHALAEKTSWFGQGSRIIITTRDRGLLRTCGVQNVYNVKCLEDDDALQLFKRDAFGGHCPSDAYEELLVRACKLAGRHPRALKEYALIFRGMGKPKEWEKKLIMYEKAAPDRVIETFKICHEYLETQCKGVFLDVACLFNGHQAKHVYALLDDASSAIEGRIGILKEKSLIDESDEYIIVHDLVEQAGKEIVRQESKYKPKKQRILWDHEHIEQLLTHRTGTDQNKGIALNMCKLSGVCSVNGSGFESMYDLRFLRFYRHTDSQQYKLCLTTKAIVLPRHLRLLHWDEYPLKTLPSGILPDRLVELNLRYSCIEKLWKGTPDLQRLRRLDLTGSKNLKELPNLSKANNLEELRIKGCTRLKLPPEFIQKLESRPKLIFERDDLPDGPTKPTYTEACACMLSLLVGVFIGVSFMWYK